MLTRFFIYLLFAGMCTSCTQGGNQASESVRADSILQEPDLFKSFETSISNDIKKIQQQGGTFLSGKDTLFPMDSILKVYQRNQYKPFWMQQVRLEKALTVLQQSYTDGLNPE